jgi:uncharacterized delta-60 repeat protein
MKNSLLKNIFFNVYALFAWAITTSVVSAQVNGSVDTSFGTRNNWAVFDTGAGHANVSGGVTDLLPLPDGRVLAAGYCTNAGFGSGACLYRWTASGVPDTTFGAGGGALVFANASSTLGGQRVRLLRRGNGAIFVAASCVSQSFGAGICVAAVNANGAGFDLSFGSTGQTFLPIPSGYTNVILESIALQPDGKLLVGATCYVSALLSSNSSICVARLTAGAVFDSSFGVNNWSLTTAGPGDTLRKLLLLPDGRYFALATCGQTTATAFLCSGLFFANGGFQRTLSTDALGRYDALLDARVLGSQLTLQWSGYEPSENRIYAARREAYTPAGAYDTSYGGYPSTGVAGDINMDTSNDGTAYAGAILQDGSALFAGFCNATSVSLVLCTTRFNANGILDASYGNGGRFEYGGQAGPWASVGSMPSPFSVAETPDGKVLFAGECAETTMIRRPCVIRLNGSPQTARACTMDIDGDGVINATTDGLILLRAMLGFSGTSALANAVAPGAARSTWPQVREYLFDQCRMPVSVQ